MLAEEWVKRGFHVSLLYSDGEPYYQLLFEDIFGLRPVGGSHRAGDMNSLAESVWDRQIALKSCQEDDGSPD